MRLGNLSFTPEVRARVVQIFWSSPAASCASVAGAIGCSEESVRRWFHHAGEPRPAPATTAGLTCALQCIEHRLDHLAADIKELGERVDRLLEAETPNEFYALF